MPTIRWPQLPDPGTARFPGREQLLDDQDEFVRSVVEVELEAVA
ncbi:MAG: hypothetical protein O3C21_00515 [Verrucomicrobia bacterium]|nr:hypothetical protein [Verrucomicrobiota bacterium]